jgi:tetratricopeptide (TPR) repeat protein
VELLVYSLVRDKQWKQAERQLQDLLHDCPGNADLWRMLAHIRSEQDDLLGAASALELACDIGHAGAKEWRDLASMYAAAGVPLMAVRAMRKGIGSSPEPEHCWRMGRLYADALRTDKALKWMNKALASKNNPDWLLAKAQMLYAHQHYDHCRKAAIAAAESHPDVRGKAWMLAGYAAWQKQDWQAAKKAFVLAEKIQETASRAAACLQTVNRILDSEHKIRMADSDSGRPQMDSAAASGLGQGLQRSRDQHS